MRYIIISIGYWLIPIVSGYAQSDTLELISFLKLVNDNHPISRQADFIQQRGRWAETQGRAGFDPKLKSDWTRKDFKGKEYYNLWNTSLTIPTRWNADVKLGYEENSGDFLNGMDEQPNGALYYLGVSVPIGRGLFFDQDRMNLQIGKLENQILVNSSINTSNMLLSDAAAQYWIWFYYNGLTETYLRSYQVSQNQLTNVINGVKNGSMARIDSVESSILVQDRLINYNKNQTMSSNARAGMENYTLEGFSLEGISPVFQLLVSSNPGVDSLKELSLLANPEFQVLKLEREQISYELRMARENIKPQVDLNYNVIGYQEDTEEYSFQTNNYKAGFKFSIPILYRKERAKINSLELKLSEMDQKVLFKTTELSNKIYQKWNKYTLLKGQVDQMADLVNTYQTMLNAEITKFENGESSVFYINVRENKLLEAKIKYYKLLLETGISEIDLIVSLGNFEAVLED